MTSFANLTQSLASSLPSTSTANGGGTTSNDQEDPLAMTHIICNLLENMNKPSTLQTGTSTSTSSTIPYDIWALPSSSSMQNPVGAPSREPKKKETEGIKTAATDYDNLVEMFYKRLSEQRQYNQDMKEKDRRWSMQKVVKRFPGWNEVTIANLHSLFLLFDNQSNGMLAFDDFSAILESLGDESPIELRKDKFHAADTDTDGWITYDEFLSVSNNISTNTYVDI